MIDNNTPVQENSNIGQTLPQLPAGQGKTMQAGAMAQAVTPNMVPAQVTGTPQSDQRGGQPDGEEQQEPDFALEQAWSYFQDGGFEKDVIDFQSCSSLVTGYKLLDCIQPFYPAFYCLGAISSLGKTTFSIQLADQVATTGKFVLYFSLEQTAFELFSKSLARGFLKTNLAETRKNNRPSTYPTPTSMDIRKGLFSSYPQEMGSQVHNYIQNVSNRMCIIHGAFSVTVEDIQSITCQFIEQFGVKPVVIVDYLQIVAPSLINGRILDTKTSIDHIVHTLKAMQSKLGVTVLAISSLNRQSYLNPIDFESFKESGGIEYTADVIWGLQLSIFNDMGFYYHYDNQGRKMGETSQKEKREMVKQAKASSCRNIDLVCLKNRYGCSSYSVSFEYYPASDLFTHPDD